MKRKFLVIVIIAIILLPLWGQNADNIPKIYVAGSINGRATLWTNGTPQSLSNTTSEAISVFVQ